MNQSANDFKLGLFALVGLMLLVAGLIAFGARAYFVHASTFETYMAGDVIGLTVGSPVELRGVHVGKVRSINFSWAEYVETQPSYVVVEFDMRDDVTPMPPGAARNEMLQSAITRGLRARLKSQGITGTSMLSIEYLNPADNPPAHFPWTPKHTYIPAAPGQLSEMLASIQKTLQNVERLDFGSINQLLQTDLKSIGTVLDHAKQVEFGAISTNANALLTELRGSNTNLDSLILNADGTVKRMELEKLSHHLDGLVVNLQSAVEGLRPGLANLDFESLNKTLANAHRALSDLDDALIELKQYPSGFLFGNPPPHVKATQTASEK